MIDQQIPFKRKIFLKIKILNIQSKSHICGENRSLKNYPKFGKIYQTRLNLVKDLKGTWLNQLVLFNNV